MPLWAESRADPRKIQANMLTDQWRQRLTHNLRPAGGVQRLQTRGSCRLNPLRMLKNRHETGYLKSSTWNETTQLTNTGINSICTRMCTPQYAYFIQHWWFQLHKMNYKTLFKALSVNMRFSNVIPWRCDGNQQNSYKKHFCKAISLSHTDDSHKTALEFYDCVRV